MELQAYHAAVDDYKVAWAAKFSDDGKNNWRNKLEICQRIIGLEGV